MIRMAKMDGILGNGECGMHYNSPVLLNQNSPSGGCLNPQLFVNKTMNKTMWNVKIITMI